uniref:Uncharacterized protein n=1 Tax=Arundo donax TaxID=35708 RepID=A0A0A9FED8_ARUDO
MRWIRSRIAS